MRLQFRASLQRIMVQTRRIRSKATHSERLGLSSSAISKDVEHPTLTESEQPSKRRKVGVKVEKLSTAPIKEGEILLDSNAILDKTSDIVNKPAKKKTKSKSVQTLHAAEALPELQEKAAKIYKQLMGIYIDPPCPLDHQNPFQLLCSVILSAQSTDKKVNETVPPLYAVAPDAKSMAALQVSVIEKHIRKIGLAPTKARNISSMSKALVENHGGEVPDSFDELEQLAGVGHKTASVVLAVAFGKPTFPVDTHIYRLGLRWGLTSGKNVEQAEADLKVCWPEEYWNALHLRLIYFGREHCPAQRHDPSGCPICAWAAVAPYNQAGKSPARAGGPRSRG